MNHEPDETVVDGPPTAALETEVPETQVPETEVPETQTSDGPVSGTMTGTTQLSRLLMAGDLPAEVLSPTEDRDSRVMWRWAAGVAVVVAALAIVASAVLVHSINPIVKTAGCDVMSRSTSCAPPGE